MALTRGWQANGNHFLFQSFKGVVMLHCNSFAQYPHMQLEVP